MADHADYEPLPGGQSNSTDHIDHRCSGCDVARERASSRVFYSAGCERRPNNLPTNCPFHG
eukprot:scaffold8077_cov98-Skeletonema_dohrnii-CCMP3373.AAC.2